MSTNNETLTFTWDYAIFFVRRDEKPREEYYFHTLQESEDMFELFHDDDSELFKRIDFSRWSQTIDDYVVLKRLEFPENKRSPFLREFL